MSAHVSQAFSTYTSARDCTDSGLGLGSDEFTVTVLLWVILVCDDWRCDVSVTNEDNFNSVRLT